MLQPPNVDAAVLLQKSLYWYSLFLYEKKLSFIPLSSHNCMHTGASPDAAFSLKNNILIKNSYRDKTNCM